MRRGRRKPTQLYPDAEEKLSHFERRYFAAFRPDVTVTYQEVLDFLLPRSIQTALREAAKYAERPGYFSDLAVNVPSDGRYHGVCMLYVSFGDDMLKPRADFVYKGLTLTDASPIFPIWEHLYDTVNRFNVARRVVEWANNNKVTPGAMRYYWPAMMMLVSESHPIITATGEKFQEPTGVAEHLADIRDSAALLASTRLLPEHEYTVVTARVRIAYDGHIYLLVH